MTTPSDLILNTALIQTTTTATVSQLGMAASVAGNPSSLISGTGIVPASSVPPASSNVCTIASSFAAATKGYFNPTMPGDEAPATIMGAMGGGGSAAYSALDLRVLTMDAGDCYGDDDSRLAYFRILSIDQTDGTINNSVGQQIFPKVKGTNSINETNGVARYKKFILLSRSFAKSERAQIIKTNSSLQVYLMDAQYEVMNIQMALKKNWEDPWDTAMIVLWEQLMRATVLARKGYICEFGIQGHVYWGYPLQLQAQENSNQQFLATYGMSFLITDSAENLTNVDKTILDAIGNTSSTLVENGSSLYDTTLGIYGTPSQYATSSNSQTATPSNNGLSSSTPGSASYTG